MCVGNYTVVSLVMVIVRKFVPFFHPFSATLSSFSVHLADRHYFIDKVLKTRPDQYGPSLSVIKQAVRSTTMAILGTQTGPTPDTKAAPTEKLDGVTAEVVTLRASNSDRNSHRAKTDPIQFHDEEVSKESSRSDVPKPSLGAVPPQDSVLSEVTNGSEAADTQVIIVPSGNKGTIMLASNKHR